MLMVKAGDVVDGFINDLVPLLEKGDIIIDGGNSLYTDSNRRTKDLVGLFTFFLLYIFFISLFFSRIF
jgi:6-phosphogluconate dehydrogenase